MTGSICLSSLRAELEYCPETGLFYWLKPKQRRSLNKPAGNIKPNGYVVIGINYEEIRAHRLAWAFYYGRWPVGQIDHINCNPSDNRIANLREANNAQNSRNKGVRSNNKSGAKGVFWSTGRQRWAASICSNRRSVFLGYFASKDDAVQAYAKAAVEYHGEFARTA